MAPSQDILKQFGASCTKLAEQLKNEPFTADDRMYVENHLLIVQLAQAMWKYSHLRAQAGADE